MPPPVEGEESVHYPVRAGDVLDGKWRLEKKMGEGGMGSVFLAHDLQLDRKVAVKLLNVALANDAELVTRFEREAKMTAGLEHPNIVPVYAVGRFHNRPFMVMKALEGVTLHSLVRSRGPLSPTDLLLMARQIASGLDFIHAKGFIHRDIKAANIFIGSDGLATILDFGILRPSRGAEALTRTGLVMGTPHYMSPEQAKGIREIDHRSDLYAFAVLLFECAAGSLPFESDNDLSVIQMQAHSVPPDLCERAPWVPRTVGDVIARAMSKDPADRYPSAGELFAAMEVAYADEGGLPTLPPLEVPGMPSGPHPAALSGPRPQPPAAPKRMPVGVMPTAPLPAASGESPMAAPAPRPSGPAPAMFTAQGSGPMVLPGMPLGLGPVPSSRPSNGALRALNGAGRMAGGVPSGPQALADGRVPGRSGPQRMAQGAQNVMAQSYPSPSGPVVVGGAAMAAQPDPSEYAAPASSSMVDSAQTQPLPTPPAPAPPPRRTGLYALAAVLGLAVGAGVFFATWSKPQPAPVTPPVVPVVEAPKPDVTPTPVEKPVDPDAQKPVETMPAVNLDTDPGTDTQKPPKVTPDAVRPGQLRIVSTLKNEPYWARVLVDGQKKGTTPLSLELRPGTHSVKVEREGFKPIEKRIKVASGRSDVLRIELIR